MKALSANRIILGVILFTFLSCEDIQPGIYEMVGNYRANVLGLVGPFDMSVAAHRGDDVLIEALFEGDYWSIVTADIDDADQGHKKIRIRKQILDSGAEIWGNGFYDYGHIQINYTLRWLGDEYDYTIVGSK